PAEITVTVNAVPATPGISASATTVCEGEGLTLTATAGADTYRWFKDGVEILGETANTLTISATELADAGEYTVVAVNTTACESAPSTGITVTVTPRAIADDIEVTGDEDSGCEGTAVTLEATSSVKNPIFRWYGDAALTDLLFTGETLTFTPLESTTFYVTVGGDGVCENEPGSAKVVNVTVNPTPAFTVDGPLSHSIEVGNSVGLPTIQAPTATVTWYDNNGNVHTDPTATDVFDTPGTYTYTAVITETDHCTVTVSVIINVFAEGECPPVYDRIYATDASEFGVSNIFGAPLGGVNNQSHAADNDINSFSELTEGVNALGLFGQTYQTLKWLA